LQVELAVQALPEHRAKRTTNCAQYDELERQALNGAQALTVNPLLYRHLSFPEECNAGLGLQSSASALQRVALTAPRHSQVCES
jgi:hypothetical protein